MKRIISISVFLLLVISLVPAGYPCGGKFLGIQDLRGVAPAIRPATILLYKAPKQMPLVLKRMGHKVKIIKDTATLLTALKSRRNLAFCEDFQTSPCVALPYRLGFGSNRFYCRDMTLIQLS